VPELIELLQLLQTTGFQDVAGTRVSATVPLSDRLLTELIVSSLPPSAPIEDLRVEAHAGNALYLRGRIRRLAFLPPIGVTVTIDEQPALPGRPILTLRLSGGGFLTLAAPALRFLEFLPPGIVFTGSQIEVNLATLLEQRGLAFLMAFLEDVRVTTEERRVVLDLRARIPLS
jgi:hypothetical protein